MIKPEQVPPEVAAALRESIRTMHITGWAAEAIAAAINAWPGMAPISDEDRVTVSAIYLPLPTEASDGYV